MTDILVKLFVKDYKDVEKVSVRTAYGVLASGVGIFCNVLLTIAKMVIGILLHSVSVTADAFNNLSDAGSSIIGMIGVKMAEKPADKEHPFGHGRLEYIAALIVSFLVIEVGFTFFKNAIVKIREPEELKFSLVSILILVLSIGVKLWLAMFNRKLGEKISSQVMMATAADALGDVITTAATILSVVFWRITGINIDGFVGLGVSLVVMWAGFGIAKDTLYFPEGLKLQTGDYNNDGIQELLLGQQRAWDATEQKQIGRLLSNKTDSKSKTASSKGNENVTPTPAKQVKNLQPYVYVMFQMQETGLQIVSEAVYGEQAASMQSVKPSQESDVKDLFYMQLSDGKLYYIWDSDATKFLAKKLSSDELNQHRRASQGTEEAGVSKTETLEDADGNECMRVQTTTDTTGSPEIGQIMMSQNKKKMNEVKGYFCE